jgi:hypothetical protein
MRVSIDTSGGDEADDLIARQYLASVIGPFRRPNGRSRFLGLLPVGATRQVSRNDTPSRVLFVSVSADSTTTARFTTSNDANAGFFAPVNLAGATASNFVLLPGETLTLTVLGPAANFAVVENTF